MTVREAVSLRLRFDVLKRDLFTCQYCGAHPPQAVLVIDHVVPVAAGGRSTEDNLVTACRECNAGKQAGEMPGVFMLRRIAWARVSTLGRALSSAYGDEHETETALQSMTRDLVSAICTIHGIEYARSVILRDYGPEWSDWSMAMHRCLADYFAQFAGGRS